VSAKGPALYLIHPHEREQTVVSIQLHAKKNFFSINMKRWKIKKRKIGKNFNFKIK
jgi:hypothetical protein